MCLNVVNPLLPKETLKDTPRYTQDNLAIVVKFVERDLTVILITKHT